MDRAVAASTSAVAGSASTQIASVAGRRMCLRHRGVGDECIPPGTQTVSLLSCEHAQKSDSTVAFVASHHQHVASHAIGRASDGVVPQRRVRTARRGPETAGLAEGV
eukprot:1389597-Prymnesium_polylepis.1